MPGHFCDFCLKYPTLPSDKEGEEERKGEGGTLLTPPPF
jgi:hypothetical protein